MEFKKILVAVDGSDTSAHALETGIGLAEKLAARIALIHVVEPILALPQDPPIDTFELLTIARNASHQLLTSLKQRVPVSLQPEVYSETGDPMSVIVQKAEEWQASMIVIGSHGRSGISRVLMGSVAENVMRHAKIPVLVVRR